MDEYIHDDDSYRRVQALLLEEMERGLGKETVAEATVKMFPTYVRSLPDGSERGNFLALDLGGTNFRVLLISLKGEKVNMQNKIYPISQELMAGAGEKLFDHIAGCISNFMMDHQLVGVGRIPLGFTFSFPCRQEGLAVGRLVRWTKGFHCQGVEGEDVVRLLHEAIRRRSDIDVECVALLNDTVGCLMSCAFLDHSTEVGVILGTGTNACYMERLNRVGTWDGDHGQPDQVIINTEWGAFGDNGCIDFVFTDVDRAIDHDSLNPGKQLFEKMISGMYLGEVVRRVLIKCINAGLILSGQVTEELDTPSRFYTKYLSEIEKTIARIMTAATCSTSALWSAREPLILPLPVSIATLLNRIDKPSVTVAVDGSLYRFHPHFHNLMTQKTQELLNPGLKFHLMLSEDGSGKGAALVAAVSNRIAAAAEANK
ncbi:hypothetical protein CAPTEDRAFT_18168 [Capitella teleta]|uniref:Phosphotransferase n=1 Tax=Capitella teleta TaxID=283909 RepID=R7U518_CAPTE|nr:hypothetical protein CAPTEDRAFT_18168 [Capitella teleta]|eukprot:ELT98250.1 hypothetical protein CAPTEDRAFT_18168 [Capitella teleta]